MPNHKRQYAGRTDRVQHRISPERKKLIERIAEHEGKSVAAWLDDAIDSHMNKRQAGRNYQEGTNA